MNYLKQTMGLFYVNARGNQKLYLVRQEQMPKIQNE